MPPPAFDASRVVSSGFVPVSCGIDPEDTDAVFLRDHFFNFMGSPFHHVRTIANIFEDTVNLGMGRLGLAELTALSDPPCPELALLGAAFLRAEHGRALRLALGTDDPARSWRLLRQNPFVLRVQPEVERRLLADIQAQPLVDVRAAPGEVAEDCAPVPANLAAAGPVPRESVMQACSPERDGNPWDVTPARARERYLRRLQDLRHLKACQAGERRSVLVIGAGPAGLMRAVQAALHGHTTTVLEKRRRDRRGRAHIIVMRSNIVVEMLEFLGVLDFLRAEKCLYPPARLGVEIRIGDLERALEAILAALGGSEPLWEYQVVEIAGGDRRAGGVSAQDGSADTAAESSGDPGVTGRGGGPGAAEPGTGGEAENRHGASARGVARVLAQNARGERRTFSPDILVVADGTHSPTSVMLGIPRADCLPHHTGITGVQADRRTGGRLQDVLYFLGDLRCRLTYRINRLLGAGRILVGGSVLQVPGQNYVGVSVVGAVEARFEFLRRRLETAQLQARGASGAEARRWRREERRARKALRPLLRRWVEFGFEAVRSSPTPAVPNCGGRPLPWFPLDLDRTSTFPMIAQRAASACGTIGDTIVVLEGDAHCTIYPESGFGCSKSLIGARLFDFLLTGLALLPEIVSLGRGSLPDCRGLLLQAVAFSKAVESHEITRISNLFNDTAARKFQTPYGEG